MRSSAQLAALIAAANGESGLGDAGGEAETGAWQVTADNGDDTYDLQAVYDESTLHPRAMLSSIKPLDLNTTLQVGERGILVTIGNGERRFFRRGVQATGEISHIWQFTGENITYPWNCGTMSAVALNTNRLSIEQRGQSSAWHTMSINWHQWYLFRFTAPVDCGSNALLTFPYWFVWFDMSLWESTGGQAYGKYAFVEGTTIYEPFGPGDAAAAMSNPSAGAAARMPYGLTLGISAYTNTAKIAGSKPDGRFGIVTANKDGLRPQGLAIYFRIEEGVWPTQRWDWHAGLHRDPAGFGGVVPLTSNRFFVMPVE